MAEPIQTLFGMCTQVGPRNHVLDGGSRSTHVKGQFWGQKGTSPEHARTCQTVDILKAAPAQQGAEPTSCRHSFGCTSWGAHSWHLVNVTEPSVCSGDAALCQITLTTCLLLEPVLCPSVLWYLWFGNQKPLPSNRHHHSKTTNTGQNHKQTIQTNKNRTATFLEMWILHPVSKWRRNHNCGWSVLRHTKFVLTSPTLVQRQHTGLVLSTDHWHRLWIKIRW